jgi:hypothetical protein
MLYHRFPNFREKLKNDYTTKVMKEYLTKTIKITIAIAQLHPYTKVLVFMEVNAGRALLSTVSNVGKSEQHFKQRTQQHMGMGEVKRKHGHENWEDVGGSCGSDAFAKHFGSHVSHAKLK